MDRRRTSSIMQRQIEEVIWKTGGVFLEVAGVGPENRRKN